MKKSFINYPRGSAEYVVLHGRYSMSKKRKPSLPFMFEKNPKKALRLATQLAYFPVKDHVYLQGRDLLEYKCSECGRGGCKLWRGYMSLPVELLCAPCAGVSQNASIKDIDSGGRVIGEFGRTDQIGSYVPAVPTEDNHEEYYTYWGYTAVPGPAVDWWKNLPTLPLSKREKQLIAS